MKDKKIDKIVREIFKSQKEAAKVLLMSTTKVSEMVAGRQQLSVDAIRILLTTYKIDPFWLFEAEDNAPIVYIESKPKPSYEMYDKYIESLEKQNMLLEELSAYKSQKKERLKNIADVSHDA
jgi:hypothetical protein